jgi:hypothetical protein
MRYQDPPSPQDPAQEPIWRPAGDRADPRYQGSHSRPPVSQDFRRAPYQEEQDRPAGDLWNRAAPPAQRRQPPAERYQPGGPQYQPGGPQYQPNAQRYQETSLDVFGDPRSPEQHWEPGRDALQDPGWAQGAAQRQPAEHGQPPAQPGRRSGRGGRRGSRGLLAGAVTGVLAAGIALGVAMLVSAFIRPQSSPVIAVGGAAINLTPTPLKEFAVARFGENDKTMLLAGMYVVIAMIAMVIGVLAWRKLVVGAIGIGLFGVFGAFVALTQPGSHTSDAIPALVGGVAGVVAIIAHVRLSGSAGLSPMAGWDREASR